MSTNTYCVIVTYMNLDTIKTIFYLGPSMDCNPDFPQLLSDLSETRYKKFSHNSADHWWVPTDGTEKAILFLRV